MLYQDHPGFSQWSGAIQAYTDREAAWAEPYIYEFAREKEKREKSDVTNNRLLRNYPDDVNILDFAVDKWWFAVDQVIKSLDWNELRRPMSIKDEKKSLVIHHTAGPRADTLEEGKEVMKSLQEAHTFTNGWGDIWYNFLIDSEGNIYEWRAGGRWVIGAHTSWNNTSSIGISLMGNFEDTEPTDQMRDALTVLATSLAREFDIDPFAKQTMFEVDDAAPYLYGTVHDSIVGHKHTSATLCPWEEVHNHLEELKDTVSALLLYFESRGELDFEQITLASDQVIQYAPENDVEITIQIRGSWDISCQLIHDSLELTSCTKLRNQVTIGLSRSEYYGSGKIPLLIQIWDQLTIFDLVLLRQQDLDQLLDYRKKVHAQVYPIAPQLKIQKVTEPVRKSQLQEHLTQNVSVLLYEVSTAFAERDIGCLQGCVLRMDSDVVLNVDQVLIVAWIDSLEVLANGTIYETSSLEIENSGLLRVNNYGRVGPIWEWFNIFRWDLHIQQESLRHLQQGWKLWWTVVNHLPFDDYIKGLFEITDDNQIELIKAVYLASKNYTAHYLTWANIHPFIPIDGSYRFVDDKRIMHQYVWYGIERTGNKRNEITRSLKDTRVSYDDDIVLLPYYQCGPGYTRSWLEQFWRTDTPWLQNVLDVSPCKDSSTFKWLWVWMSLKWAEAMARVWVGVEEIMKWRYTWVEILK